MSDVPKQLLAELSKILGSTNFTHTQPYYAASQQVVTPNSAFYFHMVEKTSEEELFVKKLYELFLINIEPGADCTNFVIKKSPIQGVGKHTCPGTARAFENGHFTWKPQVVVSIASPYSNVEVQFTLGKNLKLNKKLVGMIFVDLRKDHTKRECSRVLWHTFDDFMNSFIPYFIPAFKALSASNATASNILDVATSLEVYYDVH